MKLTWSFAFVAVLTAGTLLVAQGPASRPLSPDGIASVHVLGKWEKTERQQFTLGGERYVGGSWIDITYGRPMLRGREAFTGTGAEYGKAAYAGAPVWRAGANLSTRLKSSIPLVIGTTTVPAGEVQPLHRAELADPVDVHRLELGAGPALQRPDHGRLVRRVQLHAGKRRRPRADARGRAALPGRAAHVGVHRHDRDRRPHGDPVGQDDRLDTV